MVFYPREWQDGETLDAAQMNRLEVGIVGTSDEVIVARSAAQAAGVSEQAAAISAQNSEAAAARAELVPDEVDTAMAAQLGTGSAFDTELSATIANPNGVTIQHRTFSGVEPGTFVSFTFDDGYGTAAAYFDALNGRGIKGTLFLSSAYVDKPGTSPDWPDDTFITTAQVQAIIASGNEVGTHGVNHESYTATYNSGGRTAVDSLVSGAVASIEAAFPSVTVKTGAYPYGHSNEAIREVMGRTHEFYRGTKGLVAEYGSDPFDVPSIDIQSLSESTIKGYVDHAATTGALCIFLVHGALTAGDITKIGNVADYVLSKGIQTGTFYEAMLARTALRGPSGAAINTSGDAFFRTNKSCRYELSRGDNLGDSSWFSIDRSTNASYWDETGGVPFEFRKALFALAEFQVGKRRVYGDVTTVSGSATISSPSIRFDESDVGLTIAGTDIPGGATILSVSGSQDATMTAAATASGLIEATIGRQTGVSAISGDATYYANIINKRNANHTLRWVDLRDVAVGQVSPAEWSRAGSGGTMTWDTGTGGSYANIKAYGVKFITHTGVQRAVIGDGIDGIKLGSAADAIMQRAAPGIINVGKLAVTNSAAATTPGSVTKKVEVFDATGASLGFVAVYASIT